MKFYIASKLGNHEQVRLLADKLKAAGWVHTFDWTKHISEKSSDSRTLLSIGQQEFDGVRDADVVIVLMPGGRGTHTEFGMAIALNKIVYLCHIDDTYFRCDDNTSSFYWLPQVMQLIGNTDEIAEDLLRRDHTSYSTTQERKDATHVQK